MKLVFKKSFAVDLSDEQRKNFDEWIAALVSGKYKQGKGMLRSDDCYCCLGVACEASDLPRSIKGYIFRRENGSDAYLSKMPSEDWFKKRYGFYFHQFTVKNFENPLGIDGLNDTMNLPFDKIAKVLQAYINGEEEVEV